MLILTRRINESIQTGDDISVRVLDVKGTQVRIGVDARKDLSVDREEVRERKKLDLETFDRARPGRFNLRVTGHTSRVPDTLKSGHTFGHTVPGNPVFTGKKRGLDGRPGGS
jgi:carbon storage regulator